MNFCEIKNAKNCTELQHSVPFLRLARFGFVAEPTPRDLGCILNASALYTFCTGIFQLVYGTIIMAVQGEVTLEVMLPPLHLRCQVPAVFGERRHGLQRHVDGNRR